MVSRLKGHFSRLYHQQSRFHSGTPPQVLSEFTLKLPPTAHSVYYYDVIGNVSTSHFRQGSTPAQAAKSSKVRTSPRTVDGNLELRPRYPVLGGWNYTFIVGWDMPLGDVLRVEQVSGRKILAVPFLTSLKDIVVEDAEVTIILPEGARRVNSNCDTQARLIQPTTAMFKSTLPSPLTASLTRRTRRTSTPPAATP